jgi:hypothetical protein
MGLVKRVLDSAVITVLEGINNRNMFVSLYIRNASSLCAFTPHRHTIEVGGGVLESYYLRILCVLTSLTVGRLVLIFYRLLARRFGFPIYVPLVWWSKSQWTLAAVLTENLADGKVLR